MDIVITEAEGLRLLQFGTHWCQGVMRLDASDDLELEYAVRMQAWLLFHDLAHLPGQHLVTLGLGAGSLTRFAHRVLGMQATGVEIDARMIEACLRVVHADAADFIAQPGMARSIDQVDAYDASVDRPALDGEVFYADCRGREPHRTRAGCARERGPHSQRPAAARRLAVPADRGGQRGRDCALRGGAAGGGAGRTGRRDRAAPGPAGARVAGDGAAVAHLRYPRAVLTRTGERKKSPIAFECKLGKR